MKILVPTDFSEAAKVAVNYGAAFAASTNNPLILMNNLSTDSLPRAGVLINLEEKIEINTIEDLNELARSVAASMDNAPDIFCEIINMSSDAKGIVAKAESSNAGLIIMGSNGSSGISGALMGSVSRSVIQSSSIPVIIVPGNTTFSSEGTIFFAVDINTLPNDKTLIHFETICNLFNKTQAYFFAGTTNDDARLNAFKSKLKELFPQSTPVFHTHSDVDVVHAINEFTKDNNCMMLALAPGTHNIFDRIMGKSVTTKLIAHSHIPVLALP